MKRKLVLLPLLLALAVSSACGGGTPEPSATQQPSAAPEPSATPEPLAITRFLVSTESYRESFYADDGANLLLNASYLLPVVTIHGDEAASDAVNAVLVQNRERFLHAESEYETGLDSVLALAKESFAQGYDGEPYEMDYSFHITRADDAVLSFGTSFYAYLGGPHGSFVSGGQSFDAQGKLLSLDDLGPDPEALKSLCAEKIAALAAEVDDGSFFPDYQDAIPRNIRDGMWFFTDQGLSFVYNTYDLAPYASGPFLFTVPYSELSGVLLDKWLPGSQDSQGTMRCDYAKDLGDFRPDFVFAQDADGEELVFSAQGTVSEVSVRSATFDEAGMAEGAILAFVSRLEDESFSLRYLFPGDMSALCLRYRTADEAIVTRYVLISGEDGSLLMIDALD